MPLIMLAPYRVTALRFDIEQGGDGILVHSAVSAAAASTITAAYNPDNLAFQAKQAPSVGSFITPATAGLAINASLPPKVSMFCTLAVDTLALNAVQPPSVTVAVQNNSTLAISAVMPR